MNMILSQLVSSEGEDMAHRYVTVGGPNARIQIRPAFLAPTVPVELQKRLWKSIGYQDLVIIFPFWCNLEKMYM
jgi:hypothetical protein